LLRLLPVWSSTQVNELLVVMDSFGFNLCQTKNIIHKQIEEKVKSARGVLTDINTYSNVLFSNILFFIEWNSWKSHHFRNGFHIKWWFHIKRVLKWVFLLANTFQSILCLFGTWWIRKIGCALSLGKGRGS
jgi:hypothetical protein